MLFDQKSQFQTVSEGQGGDVQTNIATYILKRPRGQSVEEKKKRKTIIILQTQCSGAVL